MKTVNEEAKLLYHCTYLPPPPLPLLLPLSSLTLSWHISALLVCTHVNSQELMQYCRSSPLGSDNLDVDEAFALTLQQMELARHRKTEQVQNPYSFNINGGSRVLFLDGGGPAGRSRNSSTGLWAPPPEPLLLWVLYMVG